MAKCTIRSVLVLFIGTMLVAATGGLAAEIHAGVHPSPATVLQVIKAFDNPEGTIFSADGNSVFVVNAAEIGDRAKDFGWTEGQGYFSKLEVLPNGELKTVNDKLVTGLTGPLGMGVLPVATEKFPPGTIFLCAGTSGRPERPGGQGPGPVAHQVGRVQ
jgi:hypothetical protein